MCTVHREQGEKYPLHKASNTKQRTIFLKSARFLYAFSFLTFHDTWLIRKICWKVGHILVSIICLFFQVLKAANPLIIHPNKRSAQNIMYASVNCNNSRAVLQVPANAGAQGHCNKQQALLLLPPPLTSHLASDKGPLVRIRREEQQCSVPWVLPNSYLLALLSSLLAAGNKKEPRFMFFSPVVCSGVSGVFPP